MGLVQVRCKLSLWAQAQSSTINYVHPKYISPKSPDPSSPSWSIFKVNVSHLIYIHWGTWEFFGHHCPQQHLIWPELPFHIAVLISTFPQLFSLHIRTGFGLFPPPLLSIRTCISRFSNNILTLLDIEKYKICPDHTAEGINQSDVA